jgi:phosphatidylglycerophosphate synthase
MAFSRMKPAVKTSLEPLVVPLEMIGASPNGVTLLSLFVAVIAVLAFFFSSRMLGLWLFVLSFLFDMLDGALARKTNRVTHFGAYLDSVTDKIVESLIFFCFGTYHWPLSFLAGASSILVSYSKHRADEFKVKVSGGLFERPERIGFVLVSGILAEAVGRTDLLIFVLGISVVLSAVTIFQRILKARSLLD